MSGSLYPEAYPSYDNEPLEENFEIISKEPFGEGIVSKSEFFKGQIVFRFCGLTLPYQTLYTLQLYSGCYLHDSYVMGKVLHNCNPNMMVDMASQTFYARRDIKAGEYLTMDYETTEDELYRAFHCHCGASNCRKYISGRARINTN